MVHHRVSERVMDLESVVNQTGEARTALTPAGKVFVHGEYGDATSATQWKKARRWAPTG
jgi:membrane-bound ClpP family serine protease